MLRDRFERELEKIRVLLKVNTNLIEKTWKFYTESFPEGYGSYLRDYSEKEFKKCLTSPDFIKFYAIENNEIVSFSMITKNEKAMEFGTDRDPTFFRRKIAEANGKFYWISIFAVKEGYNLAPKAYTSSLALTVKVFSHIFNEGYMAVFSREVEETPTMIEQIKRVCKKMLGLNIGEREISCEVTSVMWKM